MRPIRSIAMALLAGLALFMAGVIGPPTQAAASAADPLAVPLGAHRFGHLASPEAIVAKAGPDEVGWNQPQEGANYGPWTFDVARDGSIWLLDEVNSRLLVWQPGRPDRVAQTVPLPFKAAVDIAVSPSGTVYVTSMQAGEPGQLYALTSSGAVRWKAPLTERVMGHLLMGADGVVYHEFDRLWTPLTDPHGQPLPVAQQRRLASTLQPLRGGLRLATRWVSDREVRFTLTDRAGKAVRAWRITSRTDIGGLNCIPALVGSDPVVALGVSQQTTTRFLYEYLVLRLAPSGGTQMRFALDARAVWGDDHIALRVGPDGRLYQLRSSPATGVSIARYSLTPTEPTPPTTTPSGGGAVTPSTVPPPPATSAVPKVTVPSTPPVQPQPTPPVQAQPTSRSVLPWVMAVAVPALLAAVGGGWLWYRRRHPAGPRRHGRPRAAH